LASYKAVQGVLNALKNVLEMRMKNDLDQVLSSPDVSIMGTAELKTPPASVANKHKNTIGIYLHRVSVDPFGRNRYINTRMPNQTPQPELSVNLHIFLLAWTSNGESEAVLTTWALQQIGSALELGYSDIHAYDSDWMVDESVQIQPEEMSTEDLLRIWDSLPGNYVLSVPYIVKTIRMLPVPQMEPGKPVITVVTPLFSHGESRNGDLKNGS
jgi:Pvc16 N-terminal domain